MEKKVPPYIVDVITNWCSHSMELQSSMEIPECRTVWKFQIAEQSGNSSKKLRIELPYYPAIPLLGIFPDKTIIQKDTCILVFIAAELRTAKM